jgi:PAS domain S-box-containing protein
MKESNRLDRDKVQRLCCDSIANVGIGILWIDSLGNIINANNAVPEILEYEIDELLKLSIADINPELDKNIWPDFWAQNRDRRTELRDATYYTGKGERVLVVESLCFIESGGLECVGVFFADVTARRTAEAALAQSKQELELSNKTLSAINKLINKLHGSLDFPTVVEESVHSMMDYIRYPSVVLFRWDKERGELILLNARGFSEDTLEVGSVLPVENSLTGLSVKTGELVVSYDIASDGRIVPIVKEHLIQEGLVCVISVPVLVQDKVWGAMNLICEERGLLSDHEKDTLLSIGKAIGSALANAHQVTRIKEETRERERAEKALRESQRKWRSLVENFHDIVFITDIEGHVLYANPSLKEQTGYTQDDVKLPLWKMPFIHEDDASMVRGFVDDFVSGDRPYSDVLESRAVDAWGQGHWYTSAITKVTYEGKAALQFVIYDVTPRKQAEIALQDALTEVRALKNRLQEENLYLREEIRLEHSFDEIIGASGALQTVMKKVAQVARTDSTVLLHGETGTGKELIASAIHNLSQRCDHSMIRVNCSAIPRDLFESEFFGHVKGAFTGALKERVGRFQLADGGTLFLDEISEIPLELQGKLLRVLQEGQFERVGDDVSRSVDVRLISSTNRNLKDEVGRKSFRQDLFFRLNVFPRKSADGSVFRKCC